jgi:hypothetical protein
VREVLLCCGAPLEFCGELGSFRRKFFPLRRLGIEVQTFVMRLAGASAFRRMVRDGKRRGPESIPGDPQIASQGA